MAIQPASTAALIKAVQIAKTNPHARFRVPGGFDMKSKDVLEMWRSGVMNRCNRGLRIAADNFDLAWDAARINEYQRRIRRSGCRNLLRTPEMKARYPHIDNQPRED